MNKTLDNSEYKCIIVNIKLQNLQRNIKYRKTQSKKIHICCRKVGKE